MEFCEYLNQNKNDLMFLVPMRPLRKILFISYTSSMDPEFVIPCKIKENFYKVKENYKVELVPIEEYRETFGKKTFYVSDLKNLIKNNIIKMYRKVKHLGDCK